MVRKGLIRIAGLVVMLVTMAGCLEISTIVRVKPDGTGTVTERLLISKASFSQTHSLNDKDKKGQPGQVPEKVELEKKTREMGEGVRFISIRPVSTKTHEGYEALFAFRDINLLQVNRNPDSGISADSASGEKAQEKKKQYIRFVLKEGSPSKLLIMMEHEKGASVSPSSAAAKPQQNPEQLKMVANIMKEFLKGMRIFMAVDIDGSLLGTNATYRKGQRITLMDVDFDKLIANPEQFTSFSSSGTELSSEEMQKIMKKIPGIRMETKKEVEVSFK
ncbi:MAG: hypothetical protein HGA59_09250 [Chlorobiaceae bacterium]|nr:hypothetical protein [Chlorobiaceae bacterium]NTV16596.1 hypothetical protein [Chlorobiaceae bacterium]